MAAQSKMFALKDTIAIRDTVSVTVARSEHVRVSGTVDIPKTPWDIWGAIIIALIGAGVTGLVSWFVAKYGAEAGGKAAKEAALAALQAEVATDRAFRKARLAVRLDRGLRGTMEAAQTIAEHEPKEAFNAALLDDLIQVWVAFDRLSDDLMLLGTRDWQDRVNTLFTTVRMSAELLANAERGYAEQVHVANLQEQMIWRLRGWGWAQSSAEDVRKHVKEVASGWNEEAKALWQALATYAPEQVVPLSSG